MQIGTPIILFEFGNSGTDPIAHIFPDGDLNAPVSGPVSLICAAIFQLSGTPSFNHSGDPFLDGGVATATDPTISNVLPAGGNIGAQAKWSARLSLPTSKGAITRIIINVEYPTGTSEEALMDGAFTPDYNGQSTIVQSSPGVFDISMIRNGGWPSSPRIRLHANTDRGGMTEA